MFMLEVFSVRNLEIVDSYFLFLSSSSSSSSSCSFSAAAAAAAALQHYERIRLLCETFALAKLLAPSF